MSISSISQPKIELPQNSTGPNKLPAILSAGASSLPLHIMALLAIIVFCFGRTLTSYFLADDIGEIRYVSQIFAGHPELFWSNFTGNYMQIPSMSVYRPTLLLTLTLDYFLWHANAAGYYLSNLLYFSGDVLFLYLIIRKLANSWEDWRAGLAAFFSAAIFAASPLHCESISWIVGRVDSACCFFYLAAIFLFIQFRQKGKKLFAAGTVVAFWLAITVKEMAIGLPLVLSSLTLCFSDKGNGNHNGTANIFSRLQSAVVSAGPIWLSTILYFPVRLACLGTIFGGYTGSIGASQNSTAISRWLDIDCWHRFLFPFPQQIFETNHLYPNLLFSSYVVLGGIILVRLLAGNLPMPWLAFLGIWAVSALAPIYKLWGIGYNLEGARFCFFFSMVASCFLPILLFAPDTKKELRQLSSKLCVIGSLALAILLGVFIRTAYATDLLWVHAGKEVRAVCQAATKLAAKAKEGDRIVLLGIPKENAGTHMILNGDTMRMLLSKPFVQQENYQAFLLFDPILYSPSQFINATRIKTCLAKPSVAGPYIWDSSKKDFVKIDLQNGATNTLPPIGIPNGRLSCLPYFNGHANYTYNNGTITISQVLQGDGIAVSPISISPLSCDYLEIIFTSPDESATSAVFLTGWKSNKKLQHMEDPSIDDYAHSSCLLKDASLSSAGGARYKALVPLSKYWKWFTQQEVSELSLLVPNLKELRIESLRLLPANVLTPSVEVVGTEESAIGTYEIKPSVRIICNAKNIAGATSMELQVSKTNFFFDNFKKEEEDGAVARTLRIASPQGQLHISPSDFPNDPGYSQLRCRALDAKSRPLGPFSDVITIAHK